MPIRRPAIFPATTMLVVLFGLGLARTALAANEDMLPPEEMAPKEKTIDVSGDADAARKASMESGRYGDVSLTVLETFGRINVPSDSERGTSGSMRGSGWDLRYMMRPGVGGYFRWESAGQSLGNGADWYVLQYVVGFAGRLHSTGRPGTWSIRTSSRIEWGILYFQAGTNSDPGGCTHNWLPLSTSCGGAPANLNASGAGLGTELRLAGEIDFGPLALALDIGATGYRRWSTGASSVSIPGWFWSPTAQLKFGLALPFD